ncbi:MAG: spore coat U domain-containing protein [Pontixanthobacter sp.]
MSSRTAFNRLFLVGFGSLCAATPACAQTDSINMPIQALVIDGCNVSATTMNFGSLLGATGSPQTTSQVTLLCNLNVAYEITIDMGQYAQGANRRMRNNLTGGYLRYRIYRNAGYSQRWETNQNRRVSGNSGASGIVSHTAYGQITNLAGLAAGGVYSDTVVVTVSF